MSKKQILRRSNNCCTVVTVKNGKSSEVKVPKHLIHRLGDNVDFFANKVSGEIHVRTYTGKILNYPDGVPGLGPEAWDFLEEIIMAAGDYVPLPSENWVATRTCRLRKICNDSFKLKYFFVTRRSPRYGIRINTERGWVFVK